MGPDKEIHDRLRPTILAFCRERIGQVFSAEELRRYVDSLLFVAPESPTRALRALRARGLVAYEVIDRKQSIFRCIGVA
jgi:hypothetical protein